MKVKDAIIIMILFSTFLVALLSFLADIFTTK